MTTDNSKRDIWEEVKQERKEKEEREWRNRHSVKQLKEDYPDLIPPSRYDKIFVSQIGETEFIVDDDEKENYFETYDLEPDFGDLEYFYDNRHKDEIGIRRVGILTLRLSEILERVRNNEGWIKFSQENRDWLERQEELLTTIEGKRVDKLKEDYPDLIPPSRYDEIFVSEISETEFIVDDKKKENYFEIYDLEPDPRKEGSGYDEYYNNKIGIVKIDRGEDPNEVDDGTEIVTQWNTYDPYEVEIGITKIHTNDQEFPLDEWEDILERVDPSFTDLDDVVGVWEDILERVRNETWIKFSQENQNWLEKQDKRLTPIEEEIERVDKLNDEFRDEWSKRKDNGDKSVLEHHSLYYECHDLGREIFLLNPKKRFPLPDVFPDVSLPEYDGLSFEDILEQVIDEIRKEINDRKEYLKEKGIEK